MKTVRKYQNQKGNSISVDDWLKYAPVESMALFMYQNPTRAKRLFFDVIPKMLINILLLTRNII